MTRLTICPGCQKQVLIPPDTYDNAEVACPLCREEFVLSASFPEDAPTLEILDAGVPPQPAGELLAGEEPAELPLEEAGEKEEAGEEAAEEEPVAEHEGEAAAETGLPGFEPEDEQFAFVPDEASEVGGEETLFTPAAEGEPAGLDLEPETTEAVDLESADQPAADLEPEAGPAAATSTAKAPSKAPSKARRGKKKKKLGMKTQVAGIVIFGIVGLALGYGILKVIKPSAAKPFDRMIASALAPITSLWSSPESAPSEEPPPSAPAGKKAEDEDDDDGFRLGGMLPQDQQPDEDDLAEVMEATGPTAAGDEDELDWLGEGDEQGLSAESGPPERRFAGLLNGQPDLAEVIESIDVPTLQAAVDQTRALAADDGGKLSGPFYLTLCDLGHKLAFARGDKPGAAELSQTEAADLVRQVAPRDALSRLSSFAVDMLYSEKRPPGKKGIFLVGKVQLVAPYGDFFATEIELRKQDKTSGQVVSKRVVVLSEQRPQFNVHQMAGVLGAVVREPQAKLPGYDPQDEAFGRFQADNTLVVLAGIAARVGDE